MVNKLDLKAKIIDMKPVGDRMRVSVQFDDGRGEPWFQPFDIKYERPVSLEEFMVMLSAEDMWKQIHRPDDPYQQLKDAKEKATVFVIKPPRPHDTIEAGLADAE